MPRKLAVYASKARDYQRIVKALKAVGMDFVALDPSRPPPREVSVVLNVKGDLGGLQGLNGVNVVEVEDCENEAVLVAKAALALQGKSTFGELAVGIDPGHSYGLAFVADSTLIGYGVYREVEEVLKAAKEVVEAGISLRSVVRVGRGSPEHRDRVLTVVKEGLRGVKVEVVDEAEAPALSLASLIQGLPRDVASAVDIALRRGLEV